MKLEKVYMQLLKGDAKLLEVEGTEIFFVVFTCWFSGRKKIMMYICG